MSGPSGGAASASASSALHEQGAASPPELLGGAAAGVGAGETQYSRMVDGGGEGSGGGQGESGHQSVVSFDRMTVDNERKRSDRFEDDDCMNSYAPSIVSSVLTADEVSDKKGFAIICLVILVGDMCRGIFFPIMWPLVQSLGGDTVTLGYAVAAFSFGRIISSPVFGSWSVRYGYQRTLQISVSILALGTLLYAQISNVGVEQFLILSQTVLGTGSGILGVARAFCADVTPMRNRTTYMAWLTAVQYSGFTVTPILGSLFVKLFEGRGVDGKTFQLNQYTAPAYFMTMMCALTFILLTTMFENRHRSKKPSKKKSKRLAAKEKASAERTMFGLMSMYDACIIGTMLLNVATKGSIASFETIGVAFAETHFGLSAAKAGAIVATCGSVGVVSLLCLGHLAKRFTDVQMIMGGMVFMVLGVLSIVGIEEEGESPTWRYVFAIFLIYSIGYPIGHTAVVGIFSKLLGRGPQGAMLGWFSSAGSLSRMVFPITSGYVADMADMSIVFMILSGVLGSAVLFTFISRDALTTLSA